MQSSRYHTICEQFYGNRLLFGDPTDSGIVAVEIADAREAEVFKRIGDAIVRERRPLRLFVLIGDRPLMKGYRGPYQVAELEGDFPLRYLVTFGSGDALEAARRHLRKQSGKAAGAIDAPWFALSDPIEQHLMLTGSNYFSGMQFHDLRRMQIAI
jgi:DNA polymerase, archaea type